MQGAQVQSLVRELRCHMLCSVAKNKLPTVCRTIWYMRRVVENTKDDPQSQTQLMALRTGSLLGGTKDPNLDPLTHVQ